MTTNQFIVLTISCCQMETNGLIPLHLHLLRQVFLLFKILTYALYVIDKTCIERYRDIAIIDKDLSKSGMFSTAQNIPSLDFGTYIG